MSSASQAAYQKLLTTPSLQYGDYSVTKDWMFANGINNKTLAFNPNDTTQNFLIDPKGDNFNQLMEYLTLDRRKGQADDLSKYFPTGGYATKTIDQIAEEKRLASLIPKVQSGELTPNQATAAANNQPAPPKTVYQKAYDSAPAPVVPASGVTFMDRFRAQKAITPDVAQITGKSQLDLGSTIDSKGIDYTWHIGQESASEYKTRIAKAETAARGSSAGAGMGETSATIKAAEGTVKTATQMKAEKLTGEMDTLLEQSKGKIAATNAEYAKPGGYDDVQKQLVAKTNELKILSARLAEMDADITSRPMTMDSIIGAKAQANAVLGAKIGVLNAEVQALTGSLSLAKDTADRAVDQKYAPIMEALAIKEKQLALLQPTLTAEEKKQAAALTLANDKAKNELSVTIANEKDKNATLLNLIQTYPDAGISLTDTLTAASEKVQTKSQIYKDKLDAAGTSPQDKVIAEFGKALSDKEALTKAGTRENFIFDLRLRFPQIDPSSIMEYVYGRYPDNYNK